MEYAVYVLIAVLGIGVGWLFASQRSKADLARAEVRMEAQQTALKESKEQFDLVAGKVVQKSTEQLITLADQRLKISQAQSEQAVEARKVAVETMVKPIRETLDKMEQKTSAMEKDRAGAYQALKESIAVLHQDHISSQKTTTQLATALRGSSNARGQWGQVALKNIVEQAGMTRHVDFDLEVTLKSGEGGKRPDFIAFLPEGGGIPVDAKVPLTHYYDGVKLEEPDARRAKMAEHAKSVRGHINELARRDYSSWMDKGGVDFTVLFIPSMQILGAAIEADGDLIEYALNKQVYITSPITLVLLLRMAAQHWSLQSVSINAREISDKAREFYDRTAKFAEDLDKIGRGLNTAIKAYDTAAGSFERRVLPAGRRLDELGVTGAAPRKLKALQPIETIVSPVDHLLPDGE